MIKHNKKRNTGLIKEFFARAVANSLLTGEREKYNRIISVVKTHFEKDKELYKESRLFEGLLKPRGFTKEKAKWFLDETRLHVSKQNPTRLEEEKHALIQGINRLVLDEQFFSREVPNYKLYATIQNLFNYWRNPTITEDIETILKFEDIVLEHMCVPPSDTEVQPSYIEEKNEDINALVVKLMSDKFSEKYKSISVEQKKLFGSLLTAPSLRDTVKLLEEIEVAAHKQINSYVAQNKSTETYLVPKLLELRTVLEQKFPTKNIHSNSCLTEELVLFYMKLLELNKEFNIV